MGRIGVAAAFLPLSHHQHQAVVVQRQPRRKTVVAGLPVPFQVGRHRGQGNGVPGPTFAPAAGSVAGQPVVFHERAPVPDGSKAVVAEHDFHAAPGRPEGERAGHRAVAHRRQTGPGADAQRLRLGPAPALVGAVGPHQHLRNIQRKPGPLLQSPLGEDRHPGPVLQGNHRRKLVAEVRRRAGNGDRDPIPPAPAAIGGLQQSRLQSAGCQVLRAAGSVDRHQHPVPRLEGPSIGRRPDQGLGVQGVTGGPGFAVVLGRQQPEAAAGGAVVQLGEGGDDAAGFKGGQGAHGPGFPLPAFEDRLRIKPPIPIPRPADQVELSRTVPFLLSRLVGEQDQQPALGGAGDPGIAGASFRQVDKAALVSFPVPCPVAACRGAVVPGPGAGGKGQAEQEDQAWFR